MNVYTCNDFTGFQPVGVAAVVVAKDHQRAVKMLNAHLKSIGLPGDAVIDSMRLVQDVPQVIILHDGDY